MRNKTSELPILEKGRIPRVLFVGNGVIRAFKNGDDINALIGKLSVQLKGRKLCEHVPFPFRAIAAGGGDEDNVKSKLSEILLVPGEDANPASSALKEFFKSLTTLRFDAILTTNYDYEIEKSLIPEFKISKGKASKFRKTAFAHGSKGRESPVGEKERGALYQYFPMRLNGSICPIWHIHGELAKSKTILLGPYYYGSVTGMIRDHVADSMSAYKQFSRGVQDFRPKSWVDYFLLGEVFSIGFGFDFAETDFWWLAYCKKKNLDMQNLRGKIHLFEANPNEEQKKEQIFYAETLGLQVHAWPHQSPSETEQWQDYYRSVVTTISEFSN